MNSLTRGQIRVGGALQANATTQLVAGGVLALACGDAAVPGVYAGSGVPTIAAPKGSLYLRSDGSTTNDRAYINTDGDTTWTALTTAA